MLICFANSGLAAGASGFAPGITFGAASTPCGKSIVALGSTTGAPAFLSGGDNKSSSPPPTPGRTGAGGGTTGVPGFGASRPSISLNKSSRSPRPAPDFVLPGAAILGLANPSAGIRQRALGYGKSLRSAVWIRAVAARLRDEDPQVRSLARQFLIGLRKVHSSSCTGCRGAPKDILDPGHHQNLGAKRRNSENYQYVMRHVSCLWVH